MRRSIFEEYQIDNLTVIYEEGRYRLVDNETGESSIDKSISKAFTSLRKRIAEFKRQPEEAEKEKKKRAAALINDMAKDEFFMSSILVGLISSDNNRTESEIKRNLDHFKWLKTGLEYATPKNDKQERQIMIRRILEVALSEGCDTIILGAFGCGAFQNNPEVVALANRNVIKDYLHAFKNIEFAVYCSPRDERNFKIFERVLKTYCGYWFFTFTSDHLLVCRKLGVFAPGA